MRTSAALGRRARGQREAVAKAIGPIWEANHVWLILVLVLLWTCFPKVFATLGIALHVPLVLTLIGIVLRGSAFVFRHYDRQTTRDHYRWSLVFAVASVITPITFGMSIGAISSGALPLDSTGRVITDFYSAWAAPLPFVTGLYTLALFAWLAAVYLANGVGYAPLRRDFQRRGLVAGVVAGLLAFAVLLLMPTGAPELWAQVTSTPAVWVFVGGVSAAALGSLVTLWLGRFQAARVLAGATVGLVVLGWGGAMFPVMVQPDLNVWEHHAPDVVLWTTLTILAIGSVLLVPSFLLLYRVFAADTGSVDVEAEG